MRTPCKCGCGQSVGDWSPRTHRGKSDRKRFLVGHSGPAQFAMPSDTALVEMAARLGSRSAVAREIGCAGSTLWRYISKRPALRAHASVYFYSHDPAGRAERKKTRLRAWRAKNPDADRRLRRKHEATRKARLLGQWVEEVDPMVVWERDAGMCGICGEAIVGPFDIDHVVPLALGGPHSYANVQAAHPRCNYRKGAR